MNDIVYTIVTGGEVMDERALIKLAKHGDKDAFSELFLKYRDKLYRYAYFKVGEADAYDAVMDCVAEAWANIYTLKSEKAFSSWVFRILYRSCSAYIGEQIRRKENGNIEDTDITSYTDFKSVELKEALELLSGEERDIVLLSALGGYNSKEIGKLLGIKATTARSKLSRSLAKMRGFLE